MHRYEKEHRRYLIAREGSLDVETSQQKKLEAYTRENIKVFNIAENDGKERNTVSLAR